MTQSVKHPTSAQVMISKFMSSSPMSGSVLTAQSLEPASDSVSPSLSLSAPLPTHANYNCSYFHPCTPRQLPQAPPPTPSTSLGSIKATNRQGASGHHSGGVRESVCDDYGSIAAERLGRSTRALWIEWTPNRDPPSCHQIPFVDGRRLTVTQPPPVLQRKKRVSRTVMQTKAGPI